MVPATLDCDLFFLTLPVSFFFGHFLLRLMLIACVISYWYLVLCNIWGHETQDLFGNSIQIIIEESHAILVLMFT